MDTATVLDLVYALFVVAVKIAAPLLISSMVIGLLSGLFQAVTQVSDSTLGFLPKLVAVALVFWLSLPWIIQSMMAFMARTFEAMEHAAR
jgi:flagellar biosynthetic protein FliQ